ncbi:DUF475 domain-containing protein [Sulfurimonas sp.]|uniref:DUF475 domain-containing protein n=1 Tax=Sulfurimonas sp. TaxID=2022749 RepID=UPI0025DF8D9C|nr:DUF475 domain-containing protein [Sulfurimonas sp.]MDD5156955.1 DUF475 domain-containing protein [Sulfurimonas sp.]
MKYFKFTFVFTLISLLIAGWWGFKTGGDIKSVVNVIFIVIILSIMEISLSFDNAVVNASILKNWDEYWKKLFLTAGMFIAVFGMRLLFPLAIVSQTADLSIVEVWNLAIDNPAEYSNKLISHHAEISVFGGMFLLLVFLNFLIDDEKDIHWIEVAEKKLMELGKINSISIFVALIALLMSLMLVPVEQKLSVLLAGLLGVVTYVGVDILGAVLKDKSSDFSVGDIVKKGSIGGFLYLEVLDASFSLDGVIGALAITKDIVVIMLGLGIGAMFVRSLTILLVEKDTLDEYKYLEHGAHYAIGALALIMILSLKFHISELFTGTIGLVFIALSIWSSIRHRRDKV